MNIPNDLYEAARDVLSRFGYLLNEIEWDENYQSMQIDYHHVGFDMSLKVRGIPTDIPADVFAAVLEHMIRTQIRNERKLKPSPKVISWISENR